MSCRCRDTRELPLCTALADSHQMVAIRLRETWRKGRQVFETTVRYLRDRGRTVMSEICVARHAQMRTEFFFVTHVDLLSPVPHTI